MIEWHDIDELDRTGIVLSLTPMERHTLAQVQDRLGIEWQADGSARIYSKGRVGSISLSPERSVRVTTKVPVANVLTLASLAYRTLPIPPSFGDSLIASVEPATDWLTVLLVTQIEALLAHGLRQGYVIVEDELPYVRGRLRFDAAPQWVRPGLTPCEFTDYLPDTPDNRVLRGTLEILSTRRLHLGLKPRVEQLLRSFQNVTLTRPSRHFLSSWTPTRLNRHYGPALRLCQLFLDQTGIELGTGTLSAPSFFFPMDIVFQEAVTSFLQSRYPNVFRQRGGSYVPVAGTPTRSLTFVADIVLDKPPKLVLDTKYARPEVRNQYGGLSFHNDHIYQVVFYALHFKCQALLVYPRVDRDVDVTFDIEGTPVSILTVDLNSSGLAGLSKLAQRIEELTVGLTAA